MEIASIVDVTVSASTQQVSQKGFGVPMILGTHTHWSDRWREYASSAAMIADGFLTTDAEYLMAVAIEQQDPTVEKWIVGRRVNLPTQKWTFTPVVQNGGAYSFEFDGEEVLFTADGTATAAEIVTGLRAAFVAAGVTGVTDSGTTTLVLTANTAGAWHHLKNTSPSLLSVVMDAADAGVAADLAAIHAQNSTWYAVMTPFPSAAEVGAIADWVEANKRFFFFTNSDTPVIRSTTGHGAADLKLTGYDRTAWVFSHDNGNWLGEAWAGAVLPQDPGSETWKFQSIAGGTVQTLNDTEIGFVNSNNGNWYVTVGGVNITGEGIVASGRYIDEVRGIDWLGARTGERIFGDLVNTGGKKIPMTDEGIAVIEASLRAQIQEGIEVGLLTSDPAPTFSVPKASSISSADRTARTLRNVKATAYLAGAIHKTAVTINVLA